MASALEESMFTDPVSSSQNRPVDDFGENLMVGWPSSPSPPFQGASPANAGKMESFLCELFFSFY